MISKNALVPLALVCMSQAACYKQIPLNTTEPAPATRIQAVLTDSGTLAMGTALGAGALEVEGVISTATSDSWTLQMIRVEHRGGQSIHWNREPVTFSRHLLSNPTVVVLDKKRSWLAAGGMLLGAFVLAQTFDLIGATDEGRDGEQPQKTFVPHMRR